MNAVGRIKVIKEFTPQQQSIYDALTVRQRRYVDWRSAGYGKSEAARKAGYVGKQVGTAAYIMEKKNPNIDDLIRTRLTVRNAKIAMVSDKPKDGGLDEEINKATNAIASVADANHVLEVLANADPESLARINFYKDIVNGKIKSVRRTKFIDKEGRKSYKIEEIDDVAVRIQARKELDKVLGLTALRNDFVNSIETGDITINIIDAGRKEEKKEDDGKTIFMQMQAKVETVDDEVVLVEEDMEVKIPPPAEEKRKPGRPKREVIGANNLGSIADKFAEVVGNG